MALSPAFIASLFSDPDASGYVQASGQLQDALGGIARNSLSRAQLAEQQRANMAGESATAAQAALSNSRESRITKAQEDSAKLEREKFNDVKLQRGEQRAAGAREDFAKYTEELSDAVGRNDAGRIEQLRSIGQSRGYQLADGEEGGEPGSEPRTWHVPGDETSPMRSPAPGRRVITVADPSTKLQTKLDQSALQAGRNELFDSLLGGDLPFEPELWRQAVAVAGVGSRTGAVGAKAAEVYQQMWTAKQKERAALANKKGGGGGGGGAASGKAETTTDIAYTRGRTTEKPDVEYVKQYVKAERDLYTAMVKLESGTPIEINDLKYAIARANDPTARAQSDADIKNSIGFQNLSWLDTIGQLISQKGAGALSPTVKKQIQTSINNSMSRVQSFINQEYQVQKETFARDTAGTSPALRRGIRGTMRAFGPRYRDEDFYVEGDEQEKEDETSNVVNGLLKKLR